MLVVLAETYCNKVNIQIAQGDDFVQKIIPFIYRPSSYRAVNAILVAKNQSSDAV